MGMLIRFEYTESYDIAKINLLHDIQYIPNLRQNDNLY